MKMNRLERMKEIMKTNPDFGKGVGYKMCVVDEFHDMKELEKEAEDNKPPYAFCALDTKCELWKDGYKKGAESRDKRIKELESQISNLKAIGKTSYIKGIRTMANALKKYDREEGAWTDYFEQTVDKVLKNLLKEISE